MTTTDPQNEARPASTEETQAGVRRTTLSAIGLVLFMGALSFAAVPFYDWFCRVTGWSGTTQVADGESDVVLDQLITVRFDANTNADMPWEFSPLQTEMQVRIGETGLAFYRAHNPTDVPVAGSASFNVTPFEVGAYFSKIECFCFTEQVLAPGESMDMPVTFYVDPDLVTDDESKDVKTITLSYTFFRMEDPEDASISAIN